MAVQRCTEPRVEKQEGQKKMEKDNFLFLSFLHLGVRKKATSQQKVSKGFFFKKMKDLDTK